MTDQEAPGFAERLRRLADNLLATAHNRLALLSDEAQAAALSLGSALFNIVLAALFSGFGVLSLAVFCTVLFWDTHRLLAIGVSTAVFFGLAVWTAMNAYRRLGAGSRLFTHSIAELKRDRDALAGDSGDAQG